MFNFANLPITNQGRIYHLDLLPDELADTIITVGDPKRVDWVSRYFDSIEVKRSHREFTTHTGYIGNKRLSVLSTGIGTPNIDIVLNEVEALKNIDFSTRLPKQVRKQVDFIRLGTTGALQSDISMDELVITTTAVGLDGLLHYYNYNSSTEEKELLKALNQYFCHWPIKPYVFEASQELNHPLFALGHQGITVTCPGFYGPQDRELTAPLAVESLIDTCRSFSYKNHRIVNLEMETAAIIGLSRVFGFRATSIAAVLANRIDGSFTNDPDSLVRRMIKDVLRTF